MIIPNQNESCKVVLTKRFYRENFLFSENLQRKLSASILFFLKNKIAHTQMNFDVNYISTINSPIRSTNTTKANKEFGEKSRKSEFAARL